MLWNSSKTKNKYKKNTIQKEWTNSNSLTEKRINLKNKIKYCYDYFINKCENINCGNAHSENELNIKWLQNYNFNNIFFIFHFKTELCPLLDFNHNTENCIYAHKYNELRRCIKPTIKPKLCDYWNHFNNSETYVNTKCTKKKNCNFCHNLFELNYHPLIYKTKKCESNCDKNICYKYHNDLEKRYFSQECKIYFKYVSKKFTNEKNNFEISFDKLEKIEHKFKIKSINKQSKSQVKIINNDYQLF